MQDWSGADKYMKRKRKLRTIIYIYWTLSQIEMFPHYEARFIDTWGNEVARKCGFATL